MTQQMDQSTVRPPHTRTWRLRLDIFEENDDATTAHAVLDTGDNVLDSRATARRNPHDPPAPEIGDEYAAGRALLEMGRRLLGEATTDAAANASR
jgi:hypothetical protein